MENITRKDLIKMIADGDVMIQNIEDLLSAKKKEVANWRMMLKNMEPDEPYYGIDMAITMDNTREAKNGQVQVSDVDVYADYMNGMLQKDIAKKYNMDRSTVSVTCKRYINDMIQKTEFTKNEILLINTYMKTNDLDKISSIFSMKKSEIMEVIFKAIRIPMHRKTMLRNIEILKELENGKPVKDIANKHLLLIKDVNTILKYGTADGKSILKEGE